MYINDKGSVNMMLWKTFENDKKSMELEFSKPQWRTETGLSVEELDAGCKKILHDNGDSSKMVIKSKLLAFVLENAQIAVNPNDWFADCLNHDYVIRRIRDSWEAEANHLLSDKLATSAVYEKSEIYLPIMNFNHTSPDWNILMELGIPGLIDRVRSVRNEDETQAQQEFYDAVELVYQSMIGLLLRYAEEATRLIDSNPKMEILAKSLSNLAKGAPSTLLEAMELMTFFYTIQNDVEGTGIRNMGAWDALYFPYYKSDIEKGRYTEEQLREIVNYYLYRYYAKKVPFSIPFCLGGRDESGKDMTNEFSYVIVQEYKKLNIHDPKMQIKTHKDMPPDFVELIYSSIRAGNSSFCFVNDEVIVKALEKLGISSDDAKKYTIMGCYEPAAEGKEIPCAEAVYLNMVKVLEIAIHNGYDTVAKKQILPASNSDNFTSFESFITYWKQLLKTFTDEAMEITNEREKQYPNVHQGPIFSGTFSECVKNGKDAYAGGAKYNNTAIQMYGIATLVDSFIAIKKVVFEEKLLSFEEFASVLIENWDNHEELQKRIINSTPKYGNNNEVADTIMCEIVDYVTSITNKRPNGRGGVWRCGLFSIYYHEKYGASTGATPDGRTAGKPLSKNLSATIGQDKQGLTALINSVCAIDYTNIPGGTCLDLTVHETAAKGQQGLKSIIALMNTYFAKGGLAFHLNIFDPDTLREAQKYPEKYETLQVRFCGWNEYFVTLGKVYQDEFIAQSEHAREAY